MKAWQFTDTHQPLALVEIPEREPGEGEVRVAVKACGICHSDVGLFEDEKWLDLVTAPIVPGHEVAGVVSAVGADVTEFQLGERVVVWTLGEQHGYQRDGGFAESLVARTSTLVRIPEGVPYDQAIFAEPGMTAHSAVVASGKLQEGQTVAIIGIGALGYLGLRVAVLTGARVIAVEVNKSVWPLAREAGAARVVQDITELADENLDLVVDFAGFGTTTRGAINVVRPGGRVVQVGMGRLQATIDTDQLITKSITLIGNMGGSKESMAAILDWIAAGELSPAIERIEFDDIPDGIARLAHGENTGRIIAIR